MAPDPSDTLPTPGDDGPASPASAYVLRPGQTFGPYVLRERIGEGGMGEVWKAEQFEPVRRTVALKLIKAGMDSREVLARFEAERQALALMDHPFIAKVFDAGVTELGRPYFAMEYVKGLPISEYADRRRLGVRERLELFQRVCQGVQHAHQKSVLHRDLKPSNVLVSDVDDQPRPKIIDFGVAKAMTRKLTDSTMHTTLGQLIGTPEYMSPEQAEYSNEDVDTRSDVYSLGVILYELLSGSLPFTSEELRKGGLDGVLRVLRDQDPPKPSTRLESLGEKTTQVASRRRTEVRRLSSHLRGDLDWIVMRALEKDRNRRYGSPAEFSQDIQRHLDDEPVLAGSPTVRYRMSKFVRRHRAGVGLATVAVVALLGFAITSTLQAQATARARDRAEAAAAKAAAMNDFLAQTLASADPWSGGDRETTVVQALDAAVEQIETTFEGQPELEASMRGVLGRTYLGLGKLEAATAQIERATQMREELGDADGYEMGDLRASEAKAHQNAAEHAKAITAAADASRIFRALPEATVGDLMNVYQLESRNLIYSQRYAEADSVLNLAERLVPSLESDKKMLAAELFSQRADIFSSRESNFAAAESLSTMAAEAARAVDPDNPVVSTYMNNAAQYLSMSGDLEGARTRFDEALEFQRRVLGEDHPEYATTLENRGGVLYQLGRADETLAALEQVLEIRVRNLGPDHIDVIRTGLNMGTVASITGDQEKALAVFAELKPRLIEARGGTDHPDMLAILRNEGGALRKLGRFDEALDVYRQALEISLRMHGEDHPRTAVARVGVASTLVMAKRYAEAEPMLLAAHEFFLGNPGPEHPWTRDAAAWLVRLYEETERENDAARFRIEKE